MRAPPTKRRSLPGHLAVLAALVVQIERETDARPEEQAQLRQLGERLVMCGSRLPMATDEF